MIKIRKKIYVISTVAVLLLCPAFSAQGATTVKISSISLIIDSDIAAGNDSSDVDVTTSSSKYSIDDISITNEPSDGWEEDDKPKLKITLEADDDYYFPSGLAKSDVTLSGSDGTVTSVTRSGTTILYVYITLDALEDSDSDYDLDVSGLEWDESAGIAYWDDSEEAKKYEVRLYRGDTSVTSAVSTTNTTYDFSSYITKSGDYTFKVRGVYNSSNKGSWEESASWHVSTSEVTELAALVSSSTSTTTTSGPGESDSANGAWLKDQNGWWYCNADKSYTINNWQLIDGIWYFFNTVGYMKTGWIDWNGQWYYCNQDGAMLQSTTTPDGYLVDSNGAWIQ